MISKENYVFSDLFPQFVLKLDDHFEDDFASFSEDTGIEELGIDVDFFTKTSLPNDEQVIIFNETFSPLHNSLRKPMLLQFS